MSDLSSDFVIDDSNWQDHVQPVEIDGEVKGFGAVRRDYSRNPLGYAKGIEPFNIPLIPWDEFPSRIKDMEQSQTRLSDLRKIGNAGGHVASLDQGTEGFCWAYSPASAIMIVRARDNLPHVRLSAHAVGCKIKNFRNQGGWNPQAVEYGIQHGYPDVEHWKEKSMSRSNDTPATWANAAKHQIIEGWMDMTPAFYDRNLSLQQLLTCLCLRIPCPIDLMWWRHSICAIDPVDADQSLRANNPKRYGWRFLNSWSDRYGVLGTGVVAGSKAEPDGGTAIKVVEATAA